MNIHSDYLETIINVCELLKFFSHQNNILGCFEAHVSLSATAHLCIIRHSIGTLDKPCTLASWLNCHVCVTYQTPLLEILVISGPQPEDGAEASIEPSPENQPPTSKPPLAEVESRENTLGHERSDRGNKLVIPTLDPSPHDPAIAQPTMDSFENEALAEHPQAEGEEPGEANELVEDIPGTRGKIEGRRTSRQLNHFFSKICH